MVRRGDGATLRSFQRATQRCPTGNPGWIDKRKASWRSRNGPQTRVVSPIWGAESQTVRGTLLGSRRPPATVAGHPTRIDCNVVENT